MQGGAPAGWRDRDVLAGAAFGLVAALSWALYVVGSSFGLGRGLTPWDLTAVRFAVAGAVMLPILLRAPGGLPALGGIGWRRGVLLVLGAGPPFSLLLATGFQVTPYAHGAVVNPVVVTLGSLALGVWFLGERPGPARLTGVALVLAGLALVVVGGGARGEVAAGRPAGLSAGDLLFVASGLLWAGYTLALRRWRLPPLPATAAVAVLSGALVVPAYLATGGAARVLAQPGEFAVQAVAQGLLAGVAATLTYSVAVARLGAARAGVFPSLVPAAAVVLGVPLLGEWPTAPQAAGVAVASAGLVLAVGVVRVRRWGGAAA